MEIISFFVENLVLILPVIVVGALFGYIIKKGRMEKFTGRVYPSENAVFGDRTEPLEEAQEKISIFKTDMFSFILVEILYLVFIAFFIAALAGDGDASARLIYPVFFLGGLILITLLVFIQGIFAAVTEIRIIQKGVEFKKFFPSKIITLYPENVEKIIIVIGKDPYRTVAGLNFYLKGGKMFNFTLPYYTLKAIKSVLFQFPDCEQIKEKAGIFAVINDLLRSRFNL